MDRIANSGGRKDAMALKDAVVFKVQRLLPHDKKRPGKWIPGTFFVNIGKILQKNCKIWQKAVDSI